MTCLYKKNRETVASWPDEYLGKIYDIHEKWRSDGRLVKQRTVGGRNARSYAMIVRNEKRQRQNV